MSGWPTCAVPALPPARGFEGSVTTELRARYEDITQDGRVLLTALMPGLGAVWRSLVSSEMLEGFRAQGILPILRRLAITAEEGPFSVHVPLSFSGTWRLAREADGDRIFVNMWLEARAPRGATFGPPPPANAERVLVGRVFAEHVVTRPFAPAAERRVTRLDLAGIPAVPEDLHAFEDADGLVAGRALEPVAEHVFGMMHTDSNQHVNSLVYPRLFEEAVVRVLGRPNLLARAVELRYRKPFFAGDRTTLRLAAAATERGGSAAGAFVPAGDPGTRPSCTVGMRLW